MRECPQSSMRQQNLKNNNNNFFLLSNKVKIGFLVQIFFFSFKLPPGNTRFDVPMSPGNWFLQIGLPGYVFDPL